MNRYVMPFHIPAVTLSCFLVLGCTGGDGPASQVATAPTSVAAVKSGTSPAPSAVVWHTDLAAAKKQSADTQKPMLMLFTGSDWCFACKLLKKEVLDTPEFAAWAGQNVVLMEVDFPARTPLSDATLKQNDALQKQYAIEGNPIVVVLDASGRELGRTEGYQPDSGHKAWTALIDKIIAGGK